MAFQFSTTVRNALADAIETAVGASPILRIRTGAAPANPGGADSGIVLATMNLPADFLANAANGAKALAGSWQDAAADAVGIAGHFRIYDSGGAVCHIQGSCSASGGGGDMTLDNAVLAIGQQVTVSSFAITLGGQ